MKAGTQNGVAESFLRSFALSILLSLVALVRGRSFDLFPALRRVRTRCIYQIVRYPICSSALVLRLVYLLKNPSLHNAVLLLLVIVLYDRRAGYEEDILSHDPPRTWSICDA